MRGLEKVLLACYPPAGEGSLASALCTDLVCQCSCHCVAALPAFAGLRRSVLRGPHRDTTAVSRDGRTSESSWHLEAISACSGLPKAPQPQTLMISQDCGFLTLVCQDRLEAQGTAKPEGPKEKDTAVASRDRGRGVEVGGKQTFC